MTKKTVIITGFAFLALGIIMIGAGMGVFYLQRTYSETGTISIPLMPNTIGPSGPYVLAASFPAVNDSYPVYRTIPPDTSTGEVRSIGSLFGVSGDVKEPQTSSGEAQIVDHSESSAGRSAGRLSYYMNSGTFQYIIPAKAYPYATHKQPNLPSDEEARVIAMNYLQERNLLPGDVYCEDVVVGSACVNRSAAKVIESYILTKHVHFVKEIQGIRVYNAGITVSIGDNDEVVSVTNSLRKMDPEPVRDAKIVTPDEAYQRLISGDVVMQPLPDGYDRVTVSNISLGYWMDIKTESQKYVMPVYVFTCTTPGGTYNKYVSAVDPSEMQYLT